MDSLEEQKRAIEWLDSVSNTCYGIQIAYDFLNQELGVFHPLTIKFKKEKLDRHYAMVAEANLKVKAFEGE